ncbi:hypothetical protein P3T76_007005 [Phytophthora citrophthora]|uniref:Uncharacterized protein n=1 Tax=Phytophthora citrophthora TaxID=4793 RepID=A0AAD9GPX6_9STRA|nr:hypothetical protein P3T76_007005 [Phytophthora citrophthora]
MDSEWITAESEAFGALCTEKSRDLPVEVLEWKDVSYEVMRGLFGKNFCLVNRLEARLKCNISLDPAAGKNMSQRTEADLYQRMESMRNKPNRTPTVRSIDMTNHADGKMSATIRFMSKQIAKEVYDNLRGEVSRDGETLEVTPGVSASASQRKSLKQDFAGCRGLTSLESLSLAAVGRNPNRTDQDSTGMIGIGQQAQHGTEALPPLKRVSHPTQHDKYAYIFDEEAVTDLATTEQVKLHFGVSIKSGLPKSMDEVELLSLVRPIPVLYAKIFRRDDKSQSSTVNQQSVLEGRFMRMLPLLSFLDNSAVQSDFFDTQTRRAGTTVVFDDIRQLETAFLNASESDLWDKEDKPYGQPVRIELDYTYTTSIHSELHECFKVQVAEVITWARSKCIISQEIPPKCGSAASKAMMSFKFCCPSLALLNRVREKLELCLQCEKVKGEHALKLFSFTGRALAQQIQDTSLSTEMQQVYIRWIQKKREFWVYGAPEQRHQAVEQFVKLSEELSALEVLDKLVPLDRKSVAALGFNQTNSRNKKPDFRAARTEIARIIRDCSEKL